jgi:photosystem II stability/assembly factor-like uncharacterized protein
MGKATGYLGMASALLAVIVAGSLAPGGRMLARAADEATPASAASTPATPADGPLEGALSDLLDIKNTSNQMLSQAQVKQARAQAAAISTGDTTPWQFVGPTTIGGRVVDLAIDPTTSPSTVYAAISSGGIMKSADSGVTWTPAWPTDLTQPMGALARGSDGTLWAGTGEANPSGGGLTFFGDGIYKSSDGGHSWQLSGLPDSAAFGRIVVNPTNPQEVWAAAAGSISWVASQRGIYHTTDGGHTWQQALAPPNDTTGGIDIALDPSNPTHVYATLWDHHRNNGAHTYGGVGSGLFRSTDDGATWTRLQTLNGSACNWDTSGTALTADASLGRIAVAVASTAVAPATQNRLYVELSATFGADKGFYFSDDGGNSLTCGGQTSTPGTTAGYLWVFGRFWVDPNDPLHLFNADVMLEESANGGVTWTPSAAAAAVHADQHAMAWDPNVTGHVYLGNDGGVYSNGQDGDGAWTHAVSEPWNQIYHLAVAQDNPNRLAIGLQDQGSWRTWTASADASNPPQWNSYGGGDGHWNVIDQTDHNYYYDCSQVFSCSQQHDTNGTTGTTTATSCSKSAWPAGTRFTTDAPVVIDPTNPTVVYSGGTALGRSTNRCASYTLISPSTPDSPDSLPGPVPINELDQDTSYAGEYGTITAIAPAKTAPNTIYVGTDTGRTWVTTDLGAHWTQFTQLPARWVNAIGVDPTNANHAFVGFSGYREGDLAANIWTTHDGGATWTNISGNLPNGPVEMLAYDQAHDQLYAATDFGLFYLGSGASSWLRLGTGLPNAPVFDVKLTGDGSTIYAASFGRGVWRITTPVAPSSQTPEVASPVALVILGGGLSLILGGVNVRRRRAKGFRIPI